MLSAYGACLAGSGQQEKALTIFEKAVQIEPRNVSFLVNLARARIDAGQLPQAHATLDQASALAPDDLSLLQVQLKYFWLQQDYTSARATLLKLNRLAPNPENDYWLYEVEKKLNPADANAKP